MIRLTRFITPLSFFILIIVLGIFLRIYNITPFKIYPDSYQNLLVAQNIMSYHSVVGWLGHEGMIYPPFVSWSRPVYATLIVFATLISANITLVAQGIALIASCVSILLSFLFVKQVFNNTRIALIASLLLAVSFNHVVWSGFILTEALGVGMLLGLVTLLLWKPKNEVLHPLIIGSFLTVVIFTRYEYALILFPLVWYVLATGRYQLKHLLLLFFSLIFWAVVILRILFPFPSTLFILWSELQPLLLVIIASVGGLILVSLLWKKMSQSKRQQVTRIIYLILFVLSVIVSLLTVLSLLFPAYFFFVEHFLGATRDFIKDDMLLWVGFVLGLFFLRLRRDQDHVLLFSISCLVSLGFLYMVINERMERYMTHLIPFMLPIASYGWYTLFAKRQESSSFSIRFCLSIGIVVLLGYQLAVTDNGLRNWGDKSWFQTSYEEEAALRLTPFITSPDTILLVSMPEPYYFVTKNPTQSISTTYPFLDFPEGIDDRELLIVQDMGMTDLFPAFSTFLTKHLQKEKIAEYSVSRYYHYADRSVWERHPVRVYKISLTALKGRLTDSHY